MRLSITTVLVVPGIAVDLLVVLLIERQDEVLNLGIGQGWEAIWWRVERVGEQVIRSAVLQRVEGFLNRHSDLGVLRADPGGLVPLASCTMQANLGAHGRSSRLARRAILWT